MCLCFHSAQSVLDTVNVIIGTNATATWSNITNDENETRRNVSSNLLRSMEAMSARLSTQETFEIIRPTLSLKKSLLTSANTMITANTSEIDLPQISDNTSVTVIAFYTLNTILRNRTEENNDTIINGNVVLVNTSETIDNISLSFDQLNTSESFTPLCVFWNFELFNNTGGWDTFGCEVKLDGNSTVTCECNHTTSFSILMAPYLPEKLKNVLSIITYIGVGVSLASLVICLIIEAIVWRVTTGNNTAYMRHVCIVNIALCLLIADIWFIVAAATTYENSSPDVGSCTAATFFAHFFYLAMFFWMLLSALLLLYRIIWVFSHIPKWIMMLVAFVVGYGFPLIIAVVTVAALAGHGGYISEQSCWLNWNKSKAMLAFVIPALFIVAVNFCIMIVVLIKMRRRGVGDTQQNDERHNLKVIAKCVIFLTPLFGLTWGFGIGLLIAPEVFGLHVVFALLNSFQVGFCSSYHFTKV